MDCLDSLVSFYNNTNENDLYREVIGHLLKNLDKVPGATIYDMADFCYASTSTISRLAKRLGFENYSDFRQQITYALQNYRFLNQNTRDITAAEADDIVPLYFNFLQNNINNLKSQINYADIAATSDRFYDSDRIFIFSHDNMQIENLQKALIMSGRNAVLTKSEPEHEKMLEEMKGKCTVYATLPDLRETAPMRSILNRAHKNGAFVISVCSGIRNPYSKFSDLELAFDGTKTSMDLYLFMIINNLILYDYSSRYLNDYIDETYL